MRLSVLPAVPATQTCVTGRRVRTPYALLAFLPFIAPNGAERQKQHIYASFYDGKMARILAHKNGEFHLFDETKFLYTYMGVFWSEATPVFSSVPCRMTRLLKTVFDSEAMLKMQIFPLTGKW